MRLRKFFRGRTGTRDRDYKSLTRSHRVSAYQQDEVAKLTTAFDDLRDSLVLPPCPVCGGKLRFVDRDRGGGVWCSLEVPGACSYHGATMIKWNGKERTVQLLPLREES